MTDTKKITTVLGELEEGDYFSFPGTYKDATEVYVVIEQLKELTSIKAQHGTYLFCLAKHLKVYKHV